MEEEDEHEEKEEVVVGNCSMAALAGTATGRLGPFGRGGRVTECRESCRGEKEEEGEKENSLEGDNGEDKTR